MEGLHEKAEELLFIEQEVQEQVNQAKHAGEEMDEEVDRWLNEAYNIRTNVKAYLLADERPKSTSISSMVLRKRQSKKSDRDVLKMKDVITNLVAEGKNILCTNFPTNAGIELVWRDDFVIFKSRMYAFDTIMSGLKDHNVNIIGISGMGGIGKTKLVVEIGKRAKDRMMFNHVLMATVSQDPNIENIQGALADMLGLKLKEGTEDGRADELRARLEKESKVLIILDDVWEEINMESIGVPSHLNLEGCKIIFTTRCEKVCEDMCCDLVVPLSVVDETDAWALFCEYAELQGKSQLHTSAKKIVKECSGLPLAIVTVGSCLRDKSLEDYKDALRRLSNSNFVGVESADKEIYSCLKLSYDFLEDEEAKQCFLLCSLYPLGNMINAEQLTRSIFGLELFQNVDSIAEVRNKVYAAIKKLEGASLLSSVLQEEDDLHNGVYFLEQHCVKMHDMVRDVALWIIKLNGVPFFVPTSFSKMQKKHMYVNAAVLHVEYPNSDMLIMKKPKDVITLQDTLLSDNLCVKGSAPPVFDAQSFKDELPILLGNFQNLRTCGIFLAAWQESNERYYDEFFLNSLLEFSHHPLEHKVPFVPHNLASSLALSIIGTLKNLTILQLRGSDGKIPEEIGDLCNLRLLDLSRWLWLETIPRKVLSRLGKLEELYTSYIHSSFSDVVCLHDLSSLHQLTAFTGKFRGSLSLPNDFRFGKLQRYTIMLYQKRQTFYSYYALEGLQSFRTSNSKMAMARGKIHNQSEIAFPTWSKNLRLDDLDGLTMEVFGELLPDVEYLSISGPMQRYQNLFPQINDAGFQNLRELILESSDSLECLIDTAKHQPSFMEVFPNLVCLKLNDIYQLRMLCNGPLPPNCLGSLKKATIINCPRLENIIPDILPVGPELEQLHVMDFDKLKCVYEVEAQVLKHTNHDYMSLLPTPKFLRISRLWKLESIWKVPGLQPMDKQELYGNDVELLCIMLKSLNSLVHMWVSRCNELKQVFYLPHLSDPKYVGQLSNLALLELNDLPKLECIWKGPQQYYCLHKLERIEVTMCDQLTSLFTSTIARSFQNLHHLKIEDCNALENIIFQDDQDEALSYSSTLQTTFLQLDTIDIQSCNKLKSVLPISLVSQGLPKLKTIILKDCAELMQLFGDYDEENGSENGQIMLNNLQNMTLVNLPRLVCFSAMNYHVVIPSLSQLKVEKSPIVIPRTTEQTKEQDKLNHLYGQICSKSERMLPVGLLKDFSSLEMKKYNAKEDFDLDPNVAEPMEGSTSAYLANWRQSCSPSLNSVWKGGSVFIYLNKISHIVINDCVAMRKCLFTRTMAHTLQSLEIIELLNCGELEYIFKPGDAPVSYKTQCSATCLPKLKKINIEECDKLKSVFPLSIAQNLPRLEEVFIKRAPKLEQLFTVDLEKDADQDGNMEIMLPNLKIIQLDAVPRLSVTCPPHYSLRGPFAELHMVVIENCNVEAVFDLGKKLLAQIQESELLNLEKLCWSCLSYLQCILRKDPTDHQLINLSQLRVLKVSNCHTLTNSLFTSTLARALSFLEIIELIDCKKLKNVIEPVGSHDDRESNLSGTCFPRLTNLHIEGCDRIKIIFPLSVAHCLPELRWVNIQGACDLEFIFTEDQKKEDVRGKFIKLPELMFLHLEELPSLRKLCPPGYAMICNLSLKLQKKRCPVLHTRCDFPYWNLVFPTKFWKMQCLALILLTIPLYYTYLRQNYFKITQIYIELACIYLALIVLFC